MKKIDCAYKLMKSIIVKLKLTGVFFQKKQMVAQGRRQRGQPTLVQIKNDNKGHIYVRHIDYRRQRSKNMEIQLLWSKFYFFNYSA